MKKIFTVFVCMLLTLNLVACAGESENKDDSPVQSQEAKTSSKSLDGKTLVVYYSATNHTEAVAGYIADATGGELFEIEPKEPYTSDDLDWTNPDSRVSKEHDDESRNVELTSTTVENWDDYDTVFIGYPIWWGISAWPTDSFVKANDFTGKTVIPFCTSSSSGLGESGKLLAEEAGTGNEVKEWISELER